MAAIKEPTLARDVGNVRRLNGKAPGGPLRGGPERSARDLQRKPHGGLRGGPERSARDPQTPKKPTQRENNGEVRGEKRKATWPVIVTVDGEGHERKWGPLSRNAAWKAGRFWEDGNGAVTVFLQKDETRKEVDIEKRVDDGGERFWLLDKPPQPQEAGAKADDNPTPGEDAAMQHDTAEERNAMHMMALVERITTLERENGELKRVIQEMEAKTALQENAIKEVTGRCGVIEAALMEIVQHARQQEVFNGSVRASIDGLESQIKTHQNTFQEVVRVLQAHETHIVKNGSAASEMAQFINALAQENEKKTLWIGSLMKEAQAQAGVLREHQAGQQVLAEMMKRMMVWQHRGQPQQQGDIGTQVVVTDVDQEDGTHLDFLGGTNPHGGPPDVGPMQMLILPPQQPNNPGMATQN